MPQIFVETDNSDLRNKIYQGSVAGSSAAVAEEVMQKVVRKVIDKTADFTTTKGENAKGYVIHLKIAKVEIVDRQTKCRLSGELVRYPITEYRKGSGGNEMVSTSLTGSATATGTKERSLLDCVDAITEDMVKRSLSAMRTDFLRR